MSLLSGGEESSRRRHDATIKTSETRHRHENRDAPRKYAHHSLCKRDGSCLGNAVGIMIELEDINQASESKENLAFNIQSE